MDAVVESREVVVAGHRIHYITAGSGPPVILLHGGAGDSRDWPDLMVSLSDRFSLYAPDIIGFGRSQRNGEGYYLSDFIDFLEVYISKLGLEQASLIGHSFGGRLALGLALKRPDMVKSMVLIDAAGLGKTSPLGLALVSFFAKLRRILNKPQPAPVFRVREDEDRDWACVEELSNIQVPTLIVWKQHDPYLPLANGKRGARLIPGARLKVFPGIGHAPHRGYRRDFETMAADFLMETEEQQQSSTLE